jgi:hypothetical protein
MKRLVRNSALASCLVLLLLVSCGEKNRRADVLAPKKLEAILFDYHLAQVMINDLPSTERYKKDLYFDYVYEKHGVTPMKGLAERIAEDFAFAQQKIETFSKGLSAKPVLATGNAAFQEIHEFPALEEKTKKSVKKGVQEGLAAGIEAGSYDALKATAKAAMDGAWYAGGASHSATSSAVSRAESSSKASADRLSSIESMMRQLLEAVRGGASSLAALETF